MNATDLLGMLGHIPHGATVTVDHAAYQGAAMWAGTHPTAATFDVTVDGATKTLSMDGLVGLDVDEAPVPVA